MADKIARYVLEIGGDAGDLNAVFAGIKSRVRSDVAEIKALTDKTEIFGGIRDSLPQVQRALDSAKEKVKQFTAEIERIKASGEKAPKALTDALRDAEKAAAQATKEFARQQQQMATLDAQLTRAGVNTKALAGEQQRLAAALQVATDAAAQTAAKQALGLVTLKDIAPEVARLRGQFDLLKNSGVLSATETAAAQRQLDAKIKELNASVTTTGGSFKSLQTDVRGTFTPLLLQVTAIVAALGTVGAALGSVTDAAKSYRNAIAQVGTVTTLSKGELDALGERARALAQEIGISLPDALKSLYEIIRSGVPAENAIEVLRVGALAAKAAFVDTGVGAKAAAVLIDAFGLEVSQLSGALDIVTRSAQTGGPTLTEFAETAGALGNVARATGVAFQEVVAVLNVMTDASNDAAGSASALTKIMVQLNRPETRLALRQLGLDGLSLVDTLRAINREVPGGVNAFLDLGIANTKAASAIAAVVNNADKLPEALNNAATAAGTMATALAKIYDTPEEREKRFNAALEETKVKLGETVGASSALSAVLTELLRAFNALSVEQLITADRFGGLRGVFAAAVLKFIELKVATNEAAAAYGNFGQAAIPLAKDLEKIAADIVKVSASFETIGKSVTENTAAMQKALTDQIATLTERSNTEIALLDKSNQARESSAAKEIAIRAKLNTDITKLLAEHYDAAQTAYEAHEKILAATRQKGGEDAAKIARGLAQLRIDSLAPVLDAYQKHYANLITQANGYTQTIAQLDAARATFAEASAERARIARQSGLTDLQKYADNSAAVDKLIAKGREVAAEQGIDAARKYFEQADALSDKVKGEVVSNGLVVITQFQSEQKALELIKKSADAYNQALADAKDKAKVGADATKKELEGTAEVIKGIQKELDTAKKTLSESITIKIAKDIEGIDAANAQIEQLTRTREVLIRVRTENQGGPGETPAGFNRGGPVFKRAVQQFANGGQVFNRPSWTKVPGIGNGDTVPALLKEGSFVVRKAASQKYGDGAMSMLARGYAKGGAVSGSGDWRAAIAYAQSLFPFLRHAIFREVQKAMFDDVQALARTGGRDESSLKHLLGLSTDVAKNYYLKDFWGSNSGRSAAGTKSLPSFEEFLERYNAASTRRFATGGGVGTDTVRALLTPGETVINPPAVRSIAARFGPGFLPALNDMRIPAPPIPRFAMGGPVGNVPGWQPGGPIKGMGGDINITINGAPADFANESAIRRMLIPAWREIQRRTGT